MVQLTVVWMEFLMADLRASDEEGDTRNEEQMKDHNA